MNDEPRHRAIAVKPSFQTAYASLVAASGAAIELNRKQHIIHGEDLVPRAIAWINTTRPLPTVQSMKGFGNSWSQSAQLLWRPANATHQFAGKQRPSQMIVRITAAPGIYELAGYFTQAPDYGRFQVHVKPGGSWQKWKSVGEPFNGYSPRVRRTDRVSLGRIPLSSGVNYLGFVIAGKDARSKGYFVGIDALGFTRR